MSEQSSSDFDTRRGLRDGSIELARVGWVGRGPGPQEPYVLRDPDGEIVAEVSNWMRDLAVADLSPRTMRSYCYSALMWFRVLWTLGVSWDRATEAETATLVGWLLVAPNPQRRRSSGLSGGVNIKTGKPDLKAGYGAATVNLTLAAVRNFYEFEARWYRGPVVNPVPATSHRRRALAHRSPLEMNQRFRRAPYRRRSGQGMPRSIPDGQWVELFASMACDRDRALLECFVSSGARAEELLGAQVSDVDWANQRLSVISKGSRERRWVPLSPEAMSWLGRYLAAFPASPGAPLWRTLRGPERPLSYAAARRLVQRANSAADTNWTLHDLRHTAAVRMVNSGVLTLPEVQVVLGHADLHTTSRYTVPRAEEVIIKMQEFHSRIQQPPHGYSPGYAAEDIQAVFGPAAGGGDV
jgi:integrase